MAPHHVSVVTTSTLEGWSIEGYRGFVAAHVVTGTGLFSDLAAGFSDIFGGRSGAYQKQLASIKSEVINLLREQAIRAGANWVIGARVDFDEISGKGVQMFMVSAQGTAVRARPLDQQSSDTGRKRRLSPDEIKSGIERSALVLTATEQKLKFDDRAWNSLARHQVVEATRAVVGQYAASKGNDMATVALVKEKVNRFVVSLPTDEASTELHRIIDDAPNLSVEATELIVTHNLVDLAWVKDRIHSEDVRLRRAALQLIGGDPPLYDESSLGLVTDILAALPTAFPERVETRARKKLFGREGTVWVCRYGHETDIETLRCTVCGYDKRGLKVGDLFPERAISLLRCRQAVLAERF